MAARSDYQLGRQIAELLHQADSPGVPDTRVINSLPDLLGSEPSLLAPLRDLMRVLRNPFEDHPGQEALADFAPAWASSIEISCSS